MLREFRNKSFSSFEYTSLINNKMNCLFKLDKCDVLFSGKSNKGILLELGQIDKMNMVHQYVLDSSKGKLNNLYML